MAKMNLDITSKFYGRPLLVDESFAQYLQQNNEKIVLSEPKEDAVGFLSARSASLPSEDGMAHVYISGTLVHGYNFGYHGHFTGYGYISDSIKAANNNDTVKGIVLHVGSHGGEVSGCFECAEDIENSDKPVWAIVDSYAHSAAYALASKADKITMPRTGSVGSIGVVTAHGDYSKMLENAGVKITLLHSGKHKVDGNPYEGLSSETKGEIQERLDDLRQVFVESVSSGRGIESQEVYDTEARTYGVTEAVTIGLADAKMSPKEALDAFKQELFGSNTSERGVTMSNGNQGAEAGKSDAPTSASTPDTAAVKAEAATAERTRVQAILTSEEAEGRTQLANKLAFETDMTADAAKNILSAAATEVKENASNGDDFQAAMSGENPDVGDGESQESAQGDDLDAAFSLFDKATGRKTSVN